MILDSNWSIFLIKKNKGLGFTKKIICAKSVCMYVHVNHEVQPFWVLLKVFEWSIFFFEIKKFL